MTVLAQFGRFSWGPSDKIAVIRRVMDAIRDDSAAFRELAVRFVEHLRELRRSAATIRAHWRTLAALLRVIAKHTRTAAVELGPLPGPRPRSRLTHDDVLALVRETADGASRHRHRDAAIVGLLGDAGVGPAYVLALRVQDVAAIACAPEVAAALAECTSGEPPDAPAIRGPRGLALSRAALYEIVRNAGATVDALGRASRS